MRWVSWIVVLGSLVWLASAGLGVKAPWTWLPGVDPEAARGTVADPSLSTDMTEAFLEAYNKAWSSQDPSRVAALYEQDGVIRINQAAVVHGTAGISDHASHHFNAYEDIELKLSAVEQQGDRLVVYWVFQAVHRATGRDVHLDLRDELLLADNGRIHHAAVHFDQARLQQQLGNEREP